MIDDGIVPTVFYHGTRADLAIGDCIVVGKPSNFRDDAPLSWVYFAGRLETAVWGAELAKGEGRQRIYIVEPTGAFFDDPNVTNKRFPGNPTKSYRSREPLRIVGEIGEWQGHAPEQIAGMQEGLAALRAQGKAIIED